MVPRIDPTLSGERSSQKCNTKCCGSRTPTQGDLLPPKEVPHGPTIWSDGPSLRCPPGLVGDLVVGFDDHYDVGEYHCAGCETLLYTSRMKFDCGCGWPGFWDCVPGAVREHSDADGRRVEILCTACNGHLGHVFRGEGFDNPPPNERHCVNSTSLVFIKTEDSDSPGEDAASTELTSQTQTSDCGG
eukprot:TRINITY_DN8715_c0_g2_i4.p1 TRINITY_DN8715_c0_g2~~TRINITY_DN8715_c0_g2_i4.p1  ORF type:complete len:187 (-),score=0.76 TRINITY_DN8715_c0_g2_i4:362-922(-)